MRINLITLFIVQYTTASFHLVALFQNAFHKKVPTPLWQNPNRIGTDPSKFLSITSINITYQIHI